LEAAGVLIKKSKIQSMNTSTVKSGCLDLPCHWAGADPTSKAKGGDFSYIWQSSLITTTAREMKHTSQYWCDKTMDGKMALFRERCLPNWTKSWRIKLLS